MRKKKKIETAVSKKIEQSPYEVLGVDQSASFQEIRKAYLKKLKLSPPEKDPEGFKAVKLAYTILKDIEKRKTLDLTIIKTESGINLPSLPGTDFTDLFKDRIFRFALPSSDFYIKDFRRNFCDITNEIKKLR
jgi:curved DNA-binding protein CbpA